MALHSTISRLVTQRRGLVWLGIAIILAASIFVLVTRMKLDTEVLNLLPADSNRSKASRFTTATSRKSAS